MPDKSNILIPLIDQSSIRRALRAIRQAEPLGDSPFRRLAWIHEKLDRHGPPVTRAAIDIAIADALTECIESNLFRLRSVQGISNKAGLGREEALAAIAQDFSSGNTELEAWSALYYRFVRIDLDLQAQTMAHLVGADPRQLRRRFQHGFHRLSEEISRRESAAREANWKNWLMLKLPHQAGGPLVGAEQVVDRIIQRFDKSSQPRITALVGPHGIGKTAAAHEAVRRAVDADLFEDIAWISLADKDNDVALTALIGNAIGLIIGSIEPNELTASVRFRLAERRTLVVLDDVEGIEDRRTALAMLGALVGPGHVLWLSRFRPPLDSETSVIAIPSLSEVDTLKLVNDVAHVKYAGDRMLDAESLQSLARASGGNPLAARLLAGQVGYLPVQRVLDSIATLPFGESDSSFRSMYAQMWAGISETAQWAAYALAMFPAGGAAWEDWLEISELLPSDLDEAIHTLIDSSLVEISMDTQLYWMQPLTRSFVAAQHMPDRSPGRVREGIPEYNEAVPVPDEIEPGAGINLAVLRSRNELRQPIHDLNGLIEQAAPVVRRSGQWVAWRDLLRSFQSRPSDQAAIVRIKLELGVAYRWLGELKAAQTALEDVIAEAGDAGDFGLQARALVEIGLLHESAGRMAEAEEAYQRAASAGKRYRDWETQRRALIGLAGLAVTGGRPALALKFAGEAMAAFGGDQPDGQAMSMLGHIYHQLGDAARAVEFGERAMALLMDEGDIPRQSRAHMRLGMAYHADGQPDKALIHLGQGMGLMKALGDALGQARILTNLGTVYSAGSRFDEALSAWRDAIALQEQLGDVVGMAYTWANLADLQWKMDQREAARDSLKIARGLAEERGLVSLLANLDAHPSSQS